MVRVGAACAVAGVLTMLPRAQRHHRAVLRSSGIALYASPLDAFPSDVLHFARGSYVLGGPVVSKGRRYRSARPRGVERVTCA